MPPTPHRRLSLKQKLPLLICGLVLAVVVVDSAASYGSVRNASLAVGRERLRSVSEQIAELLTTATSKTDSAMRVAAAGQFLVIRFLQSPSEANKAAALTYLRRPSGAPSQRVSWMNCGTRSANLPFPRHPELPRSTGPLRRSLTRRPRRRTTRLLEDCASKTTLWCCRSPRRAWSWSRASRLVITCRMACALHPPLGPAITLRLDRPERFAARWQ